MPPKKQSNGNGNAGDRAELGALTRQLAALPRTTVGNLQAQFRELTGEPTRTRNKEWLVKRVAYLIQQRAHGGLSERAQVRLSEIGDRLPATWQERLTGQAMAPADAQAQAMADRDPRLPAIGETIKRTHNGAEHSVTVLAASFVYQGKHYKTLSEIAKLITGTKWNGFRFFGINVSK